LIIVSAASCERATMSHCVKVTRRKIS